MSDPNFTILYVDSPKASAVFYGDLLGREPVQQSPTFALFALANGQMLGLWARDAVEPAAPMKGDCGELAFPVANDAALETIYGEWRRRGLDIAQQPTRMDFGHTFVALDPNGHRLRVFVPAA
jgi:catechol 2,3-dioxygenase-like lactoylglutathione lyase family enzyme